MLNFKVNYHGDLLAVTVRGDAFTVERLSAVNESIEILHKGELHSVVDSLTINL